LPVDWYGRPNSFECPAGTEAGEGWILLPRSTLDALDLNSLYPLTVTCLEQRGVVTAQVQAAALLIVDAVCVSPGLRGDAGAPYLCRLADRRHLYQHIPLDKAYNVVQP